MATGTQVGGTPLPRSLEGPGVPLEVGDQGVGLRLQATLRVTQAGTSEQREGFMRTRRRTLGEAPPQTPPKCKATLRSLMLPPKQAMEFLSKYSVGGVFLGWPS